MLLAIVFGSACSTGRADTRPVARVAYVADLSGEAEAAERAGLNGAAIALAEINSNISLPCRLELLPVNLAEFETCEAALDAAMADLDLRMVIFADGVEPPIELIKQCDERDILSVTASQNMQLPAGSGMFRSVSSWENTIQELARYTLAKHLSSIVVVQDSDRAMFQESRKVIRLFKETGIHISRTMRLQDRQLTSFDILEDHTILEQEAILLWLHPDNLETACLKLRHSGYTGLILAPDSFGEQTVLGATGPAGNHVVFAAQYRIPKTNEETQSKRMYQFLDAYEQKYEALPVSVAAFSAYDSIYVLAAVLEAEPAEGAWIASLKDLPAIYSLAGSFSFAENAAEPVDKPIVFIVENGQPTQAR